MNTKLTKINRDCIVTNVCCNVVSKQFYDKNMKGAINLPFHDMVIVFDIPLSESEKHKNAALITDSVLKSYDLTLDEVYKAAIKNTKTKNQFRVLSLKEATIEELKDKGVSETVATALMNKTKNDYDYFVFKSNYLYGRANAMLYNDILQDAAAKIEGNYYILPYGGDDVIIVKEKECIPIDDMIKMYEKIKKTTCIHKPLLSESIYYYNRQNCTITIIRQEINR